MMQASILNQSFSSNGAISLPTTPLFGTDGIRGKAGHKEFLNPSLAFKIGFWAGQVLQKNNQTAPVILGQDSRNSSDMLSKALSGGLNAVGVEVWNVGLCPTPTVAHLTNTNEAMGGIMISASHNPPEYNGIKFFGSNGTKLSSQIQAEIEAGIRGELVKTDFQVANSCRWGQYYNRPELIADYLHSLQKPFRDKIDLSQMRVVLDLAWGAAVDTAPAIFKAMGAEVIILNGQANAIA